ncbi:hypothetical protein IFM89_021887 [Coptis chinensis]|uniref:AAA+ ATPase domain-containing protein n=1 Tax=Coptis chinensis TaxID=261450 RepID=A0A835LMC0_9MAGN|nr:hypothetical protein IFM89_021887 [Coptis chinensis]
MAEVAGGPVGEAFKCTISHTESEFGYLVHFRRNVNGLEIKSEDQRSAKTMWKEKFQQLGTMEKCFTCTVSHIERELGYLVNFRRNVNVLNVKIEDLRSVENDVERKILAARNKVELIKDTVENWQGKARTVLSKVTELKDEADLVNSWYKGWCTCSRFRLGRRAEKNIADIQALMDERNIFGDTVSVPKPAQSLPLVLIGDFIKFASRAPITQQIREVLLDENASLVGVYGMPGVGKTMLIDAVTEELKREKLYDEVVKVTVSQNLDLQKIQGDIAKLLGQELLDNDPISLRAGQLFERLSQNKKILVILDDLWERVELAKLGIPCKNNKKGCKVVFTTRDQGVCNIMESDLELQIGVLSEEDSWSLFRLKAGQVVDSLSHQTAARDIVTRCEGLPLAIVTLGRALRNKDATIYADALNRLKKSIFYDHMSPVTASIRLSYDYLQSETTRFCFLFCCMFPEDFKIDFEVLLTYVKGENLVRDVNTLGEARGRLHAEVDKLASSGLLSRAKDGYIMMHDVIRDVATSIASEEGNEFIMRAGLELRDWPDLGKCKRLSLMNNKIRCALPYQIEAPQLLTLSLSGTRDYLSKIPDDFFQETKSLKTLDLSHTNVDSLPPSLSCLVNLRTLRLEYCHNLVNVNAIEKLEKLEILSLFHSGHSRFPNGIKGLRNLRLLNLSYTDWFGVKSNFMPNVISSLTLLEELYLMRNLDSWEVIGTNKGIKEIFYEIASLTCLTSLEFYAPLQPQECLSQNILFQWDRLEKFKIHVGWSYFHKFPEQKFQEKSTQFHRSMFLQTPSVPSVNWVAELLEKTNCLFLYGCLGVESVGQLDARGQNENLKYLEVGCSEMKYLMSTTVLNKAPKYAFSKLEELHFETMQNLEAICKGTLPHGFLSELRILEVDTCNKVTILIPSHLLVRLKNLEDLKVRACAGLELLIQFAGGDEAVGKEQLSQVHTSASTALSSSPNNTTKQSNISNKLSNFPASLILPRLRVLEISSCWKLKYLFRIREVRNLLKLETLCINYCTNMEVILEQGNDDKDNAILPHVKISTLGTMSKQSNMMSSIFPNLRVLEISSCKKLKYLFPTKVVPDLLQLEMLSVVDCEDMEVILEHDNDEENGSEEKYKVILPRLKTSTLGRLPRLTSFSRRDSHSDWPSLEELKLYECDNLKKLPLGADSVPRLKVLNVDPVWFDQLEWQDQGLKTRLQTLLPVYSHTFYLLTLFFVSFFPVL